MPSKANLIRITIALMTLVGVSMSFLAMNLISGPGEVCYSNNYFGEYWLEVLLLLNAIGWGLYAWVREIRIYWAETHKPKGKRDEDEEWGV